MLARLPLPARHSPEAKPMADGQGTSGQALYEIVTRFYLVLKNLVLWARSEISGSAENFKSA